MIISRRRICAFLVFLIGASVFQKSVMAGPNLPPAPYKPLPVGAWFSYGSWGCEVKSSAGFETVCAGGRGRATTYGVFVVLYDLGVDQVMGSVAQGMCATPEKLETWQPIGPTTIDAKARSAIERLWPLQIGNRVEFRISTAWGNAKSTLTVDRTEHVEVAGKTQLTFVVTQDVTLPYDTINRSRSCDLTYRRTIWYDPSRGLVLRDRMRWQNGAWPGVGWQHELVFARFPKPRPAARTAIRIAKEEARLAELRAEQEKSRKAEEERLARLREEEKRLSEERRHEEARLKELIAQAETKTQRLTALQREQAAKPEPNFPAYIRFGDYHALVIGIDDYENLKPLKTAVADAEAVAAVLEGKYGFKVTKLINPSREDILDALDALRETLTFKDNLLIYYAGHGWLDEKADQGYWLPANAKKNRRSRWVSNAAVTNTLKALESKHVMVVSDSCYSGRLVRSAAVRIENVDTPEYFQKMSRKKARVVITSGGLEPVEDGKGLHSPFARAFLKALEENDGVIDGTRLFTAIRRPVMVSANQTPQYADVRRAGHEGGEFLFVRRR